MWHHLRRNKQDFKWYINKIIHQTQIFFTFCDKFSSPFISICLITFQQCILCSHRGTHHWVPRTQRLFGGQIVGQALVAAAKSVSDSLYAHSLHCYFVRAGKMSWMLFFAGEAPVQRITLQRIHLEVSKDRERDNIQMGLNSFISSSFPVQANVHLFSFSVSYDSTLLFLVFSRWSEGSGALPGGPHARRPQLHRALCEGHPAWTAHTNLPSLLPNTAAQPPAAPVPHASGPSAWRPPHRGGTYSPLPQVALSLFIIVD